MAAEQQDMVKRVWTIGIGGAAGDGVKEAAASLGTILAGLGYEVFVSFTYPSLIRGGHNFARISFGREKVWTDEERLDLLVALNEEAVLLHQAELKPGALVLGDATVPALPMLASAKELGAPAIARSSVALGAAAYLIGLPLETLTPLIQKIFQTKHPEANLKLAEIGYEHLRGLNAARLPFTEAGVAGSGAKELIDGNTAFARGLLAAGLDFYVSYPMTPATSILHYLAAREAAGDPIKVIQPESELAVINMALGVSYAGKRVAIGSATGGFALMTEALSFAGGAELPLVIAVSQRQAPATGVPTYSSQTDLRFALHAGHGEFPRVVIAPGDAEEAFQIGARALNLAWQYQLPVIVLLDKIISEHAATALLPADQIKIERGKIAAATGENYGRYEITPDGISPLAFPGTPETVVKVTSYEHDQAGITADLIEPVRAMIDKRFTKAETLRQALTAEETLKIYGDPSSEIAIVFWGSTKGPVLEAAKFLKRPVKLIQALWLAPFPAERWRRELEGVKKIINVEANHDAQFAGLLREQAGAASSADILRYDSRPFDAAELAERINNLLN